MRGVFMEKTVRKIKIPVLIAIIVLILTTAAVIYFVAFGGKNKEPNRGTYVMGERSIVHTHKLTCL